MFKYTQVVVAALYNRVDKRDELEIKNGAQISGGWCGLDVVAKNIYREGRCEVFAITLIASV